MPPAGKCKRAVGKMRVRRREQGTFAGIYPEGKIGNRFRKCVDRKMLQIVTAISIEGENTSLKTGDKARGFIKVKMDAK